MTVYVLTVVWQFDSGETGNYVHVYDSLEKAQAQMKLEIKIARNDMSGYDIEETNLVDGDMSYSIWERENYCYNHEDINIYQREVK